MSIQQLLCAFCALQYNQLISCWKCPIKSLWTLNVTDDQNRHFHLKNSHILWSSSVHTYMWSIGFSGNSSLSSAYRSINLFIDLSWLCFAFWVCCSGVCSIVCLTHFQLFTLLFSCLNSRQTRANYNSFNVRPERLKKALWEHSFLLAN